jgi:hypothetical protein
MSAGDALVRRAPATRSKSCRAPSDAGMSPFAATGSVAIRADTSEIARTI